MSSAFFTTDGGDVILRAGSESSSKHDFCVHKVVLSLTSPVFKDLFRTAQPDEGQGLLPVVPVTDPPESVDLLLRFIYPGLVPPATTDLSALSTLLTIADKYAIATVSLIVKQRLATGELLTKDPFGVYIVARRWGFTDEAKAAARGLTLKKVMNSPSSKNPQNFIGEDFFRLMWFIQKRGEEGKRAILKHFVWNRDCSYGEVPCGTHSGGETVSFYESLVEEIVDEFEVDPCLDVGRMVRIFVDARDPPDEGFCYDTYVDHTPTFCPTRPSTMVEFTINLTTTLKDNCNVYLEQALDGEFPA